MQKLLTLYDDNAKLSLATTLVLKHFKSYKVQRVCVVCWVTYINRQIGYAEVHNVHYAVELQ